MFFPEKIKSIGENDKVLEVGPGASPFHRSNVLLEKNYDSESEYIAQTGHVGKLSTSKPVIFYDGGRFPFEDNEFDYIICSHVLEHVDNADTFLSEVQRVAKRGYLEYPTVYYDYIYNISEHQLFLLFRDGVIYWMKKEESSLQDFAVIQSFFFESSRKNYKSLINELKLYFFQGFEWSETIPTQRVYTLEDVSYDINTLDIPKKENSATKKPGPNMNLKQHLGHSIRKALRKYGL